MTIGDPRASGGVSRLCHLPSEAARRIDEICDVFETQLSTERHPRIEEFLGAFREPERSVLLRELLWLELETYLSAGEFPDLEKYCKRFPESTDLVKRVFEEVLPSTQPAPVGAGAPWPNIPNYHILERLGEGGMGTVFKAIHTKLQSFAAVKVLRADRMEDIEATVRFQREMKVVGNLSHPNIVEARDAGESDGTHYLIMEYVEGLDLGNVLCRLGPFPLADACEIARRVSVALQYAHEHNLVHRDIKPSNLLLGHPPQNLEQVQVKVADLGLARLLGNFAANEHAAQYGRIMGTFRYMAPEQYWAPDTVDIRSDIYSLGCTLHALLLGRPPFSHPQYRDARAIMSAHRDSPVPSFRRLRPDVSQELEETILLMMAKQPDRRPQTPGRLVKSLACFSGGSDLPGLLARAQSQLPGPITGASATTGDASAASSARCPRAGIPTTVRISERDDDTGVKTEEFVPEQNRDDLLRDKKEPYPVDGGRKVGPSDVPRTAWSNATLWWNVAGVVTLLLVALLATWLSRSGTPKPVDLLALVELNRDALGGRWKWDDRTLVSPDVPRAIVELPYQPSSDYKMEIDAERVSGGRWVIGLLWQGHQVPIVMDEVIVQKISSPAPRAEQMSWAELPEPLRLAHGKPRKYTCIVRDCGFVVAYEDQLRVSYVTGDKQPKVETDWLPANHNVLFLGSSNSVYRFKEVILSPISFD